MKHVLITGSTRGIGFGLANFFLKEGCKVTVNGTTDEGVEKAVSKLEELHHAKKVQGFAGNVAIIQDVESLWNKATESYGNIDIWINNAGITTEHEYAWKIRPDNVKKIIDINLLGTINGSTVATKKMIEQGHGQIYNMEGFGSDGMTMKKMTLYGTTKRALRYFTRSLAKEAEGSSIQVGTISPGMVITDLLLSPLSKEDLEKNKKIFNILADEVDTVASFLTKKILNNKANNAQIAWLTKRKIFFRFIFSPIRKRNLFND